MVSLTNKNQNRGIGNCRKKYNQMKRRPVIWVRVNAVNLMSILQGQEGLALPHCKTV